jgi:alpha-glucosidase (family GH31 glycosyl hydrolase)
MKAFIFTLLMALLVVSSYGRPMFNVEGNIVHIDIEGIGKKARVVRVEVLTNSAVRITTSTKAELSGSASLTVRTDLPPVKFKAGYKDYNVEITAANISVTVFENGLISIFNRKGNRMIVESDKNFTPVENTQALYQIKQRLFLSNPENIYGLGQAENAHRFGLRGKKSEVVQNKAALASPIFYSEKGYAFFWENYSATSFIDTRGNLEIVSELANEIQYVVVYGPEWDKIVADLRTITGKAPLLPRWAYGFWHSPSSFTASQTTKGLTTQYNGLGLPVETFDDAHFNTYTKESALIAENNDLLFANALAPYKLKAEFENLLAGYEKRICLPTRSAVPGMQKYGTYVFAGDVPGCWAGLKNQVAAGMNITLAGHPYWSTNIGGVEPNGCNKEPFAELLTRWYQFAAFNPIFQVSSPNREIWAVSKPGDGYYEAISDAIKLRYRLLPYIYSVAHHVYANDHSMVRPLMFSYADDAKVADNDRQFLFGASIMVCPVPEAGAKTMNVYFPAKEPAWYDFWTGKQYDGGADVPVKTEISKIPLFVKAGSIVPMGGIHASTIDSLVAPLEIRVYDGAKGSFSLYEDQYDGQGYKTNLFTKIVMNYDDKSKTLDIGQIEGTFPNSPVARTFKAVLVNENKGVGLQATESAQLVEYKGKRVKVKFE